ncbi:MAG: hypothetical protein ACXWLH_02690 [Candidatus Saccharimonadales bacterium]
MSLLKNKLQVLVSLIFLGYIIWWISFQRVVNNQGLSVQRFGYIYGSMALIGAIIGFVASIKWGGFKSVVGKALMFFSFGLLAQEAGQLILAYYIYVSKIQIPYPSLGDIAYFGSTLFYLCGGIFLAKAVGVKFSLKSNRAKLVAFLIPALLLGASYWVFLHNHQYDTSHPLTVFLDFGYPFGDALYISMGIIAFLLSRKMLGGIMRAGILILIFALIAQYIADWTFLYQSSRGTYLSGKYDDLFYLIAYFITTTAVIKFHSTYNGLRSRASETKTQHAEKEGV